MPLSELTDRNAVLAAIREYDALGQQAFLKKYGFAPARRFRLLHNGNSYDSKAIAGAAFGYQFPDRGPLKSSEFSGGEETVRPLLEGLGFKVSVDEVAGLNDVPMITAQDIQLIRQSRTKDPDGKIKEYDQLSGEQRATYLRVHNALHSLGSSVRQALGGQFFSLALTSQFHPESGVRSLVPKDLWFAVYNARNRDEFVGMPQLFMIVSERGIEYGFAASIHPSDFSTPAVKQRVRTAMPKIFAALPSPASPEANALSTNLDRSGGWFFQRKSRLLPGTEGYHSLDEWLSFLKSSTGSGGSISRYLTEDDLQRSDLDLTALSLKAAEIFSSLMLKVTPMSVVTKTIGTSVQASLEEFLSKFPEVRSKKPFGEHDELKKTLNTIRSGLENLPALRAHPNIRISWSLGAGNWARIPWISLMDEEETTSTQRGTYCVFLFPEDMSGVYLTFNQGVTETIDKHGRHEGRKVLRQQAQAMRSIVGAQISSRFNIDDEIDLRNEGNLGQDYEASTVAYRLYTKGGIPPDTELDKDLSILLAAYAKVLPRETPLPTPPEPRPTVQPTYTIDDFVRESRLSSERIKRWQASLLRKKQIILQGPPGTGKTFVAERLARLLASDTTGFWDTVQFHPSYAYEDFMQGIRPSVEGGAISYSIEPGRFLQFCKRAKDTGAPAVLIIDEIKPWKFVAGLW